MNEETQEEIKGTEKENTEPDTTEGDKPKKLTDIEDANLAAKRLEDATKVQKEENDRTEKLLVESRLGGKTEAGTTTEPKEETPKEYRDKIMRGEDPKA